MLPYISLGIAAIGLLAAITACALALRAAFIIEALEAKQAALPSKSDAPAFHDNGQ